MADVGIDLAVTLEVVRGRQLEDLITLAQIGDQQVESSRSDAALVGKGELGRLLELETLGLKAHVDQRGGRCLHHNQLFMVERALRDYQLVGASMQGPTRWPDNG